MTAEPCTQCYRRCTFFSPIPLSLFPKSVMAWFAKNVGGSCLVCLVQQVPYTCNTSLHSRLLLTWDQDQLCCHIMALLPSQVHIGKQQKPQDPYNSESKFLLGSTITLCKHCTVAQLQPQEFEADMILLRIHSNSTMMVSHDGANTIV